MTKTIIAFDQSTDKTGMVIVRFDDRGALTPLYSETRETPTPKAMCQLCHDGFLKVKHYDADTELMIACEDGFYMKQSKNASLDAVRKAWTTQGWIQMFYSLTLPWEFTFDTFTPKDWRKAVWGNEWAFASGVNCKAHAILFGRAHGLDNPTDHEGEALAIAYMGFYSLGGINLGKVDVKV